MALTIACLVDRHKGDRIVQWYAIVHGTAARDVGRDGAPLAPFIVQTQHLSRLSFVYLLICRLVSTTCYLDTHISGEVDNESHAPTTYSNRDCTSTDWN